MAFDVVLCVYADAIQQEKSESSQPKERESLLVLCRIERETTRLG
jgi:hypothetical protein